MATHSKLPSGSWRVQVARKGRYIIETFIKRDDARRWATETEGQIDRNQTPVRSKVARPRTFKELIDSQLADVKEVGKAPGRSKAATLKMLSRRLGRPPHSLAERRWGWTGLHQLSRPDVVDGA